MPVSEAGLLLMVSRARVVVVLLVAATVLMGLDSGIVCKTWIVSMPSVARDNRWLLVMVRTSLGLTCPEVRFSKKVSV